MISLFHTGTVRIWDLGTGFCGEHKNGRLSFHLIPCGSRDYALRARYVHIYYYRAYHYVMMVNELVDDNTVAAPWNDDWRQELHSFLSW